MILDSDDAKRHKKENEKIQQQLAVNASIERGKVWKQTFGENELQRLTNGLRAELMAWNQLFSASIPLSLQTIDTMLLTLSSFPTLLDKNIIKNHVYQDRVSFLNAIRNKLIEERNKNIAKVPYLSTGSDLERPTI